MSKWAHGAGAVIAGKYRITGTLGQGGMGSVYEAVNDAVGKRVALKVLNANLADQKDFLRRFELEARAASLINHPGIVDVLDFGRAEDGSPYMVMEHLSGLTVRALQRKVGPMPPALAAAVVLPVLDALAAAHAAGVVHRDLKPANVFLAVKPRQVKILDFGISKFSTVGDGMTQTGTTLGTPAYMAPEQLKSGRSAGPLSDLYAVGAVLYSLVTGHPPFEADSDYALVAQVLTTEHTPVAERVPGLPEGFAGIVDGLLSKDPARRPASAAALKAQLAAVVAPDSPGLFALAEQHTVDAPAPPPTGPLLATPLPPEQTAGSTRTAGPTRPGTPQALEEARSGSPGPPQAPRWRYAVGLVGLMGLGALAAVFALRVPQVSLPAGQAVSDGGFAFGFEAFLPQMNQARALAADGGTAQALALLDAALQQSEQGPDRRVEAFAARNRGNLAKDLERCSEAATYYLRALKSLEQAGDRASVGLLANDLGMLALGCPELDRVTWFKLAVKARWEVRDLAGVRRSANNLGVAYLNTGDYESADHAYNEALIAATELKDQAAIVRIKSNLSFVWALIADGPKIRDGGTHFDRSTVAWKKSTANWQQSMATAKDAGLTGDDVCNGWEQFKEICLHLGD